MILPQTSMFKWIIVAIAFIAILGLGYKIAYNHGVSVTENKYLKAQIDYREKLDKHIGTIETSLTTIASNSDQQSSKLASDMSVILANVKKQPSIIYKDGKCSPSTNYINSINEAVTKVNTRNENPIH